MRVFRLARNEWLKTLAIGLAAAVLTAAVMQTLAAAGVSPLPMPLGLAFARTVLGAAVPLPVGLLFHTAWVIGWCAAYVVLFRDALSLGRALALGAALWLSVLFVFFPVVGWGVLGLAVAPKLMVAAGAVHLLFALLLWALCRAFLGPRAPATD